MLRNGSFSEGWTDLEPAPGFLINQQPNGWTLRWLELGESLFGADDKASGVPECVHKLSRQLPPNEQLGGNNALILEGDTTYKIFHATSPFGGELTQVVTGLQAGSHAKLTVPIQVHRHGDPDPYGAESGAWVNGEGHWVNSGDMGDRRWYEHVVEFTVPDNGTAEIVIRVKSKWPRPKDFFIDGVKLAATAVSSDDDNTSGGIAPGHPGGGGAPAVEKTIHLSVPAGVRVETEAGDKSNVVVVYVPPGYTVELN
ncbi:MAG: hypothetical protein KC413_08385 [Anaerolineales bacterium]|nr:hypothetical protein [Anaerolineales bacterium]